MTTTLADIVAEGERLLALADESGLELRLLGGVAVRLRTPGIPAALDRQYKDLDFAVRKKGAGRLDTLMREAGYEPHVTFNAMNARERALYLDEEQGRQVDVFIESFRMCHEIALGERIGLEPRTLPLAELLLTKLQIVELNEKDVRDTVLLLHGHDVAEADGDAINAARIADLCSSDWGLWRTITANLESCRERIGEYALEPAEAERVSGRIGAILDAVEQAPKSRGWRRRAKVGDRKPWYELPEEVAR
jgi:Uncharacterised nucleotidyltransferase